MANNKQPFFLAYSLVLLCIVLAGFAPSFFLRFAFQQPPLLPYLYLHGAFLTGWFVWLVAQAWLIRVNKPSLHRRLGYVGAGYGVLVVLGGLLAVLREVSHDLSQGVTFDTLIEAADPSLGVDVTYLEFISHEVWVSLADLGTFAVLLGAAIVYRRHADIHKRLILLAALVIVSPALGRISRLELFGGEGGPLVTSVMLALLASLVIYDWLSLKKIHGATIASIIMAGLLHMAGSWIAVTELGQDLVRKLG